MKVVVHQEKVFELLDALLARWKSNPKQYPYNNPDAIIPQTIIPQGLRADKVTLSRFYFYVCIYMRGGIESLQAFKAMIRIWEEHPTMLDPYFAQWTPPSQMQALLKKYVGWDSKAASINWIDNSRRLMQSWKGEPLRLVRGVRDYDEACRRIKNKLGKGERAKAGHDGHGFRGFQYKMVSMLLYFYDWEGWLTPRFLYPSPADFHNFRLGLNQGAIEVVAMEGRDLRSEEALSKPWREAVMAYMRERRADPVEVSDALWLFSLVTCGASSLTQTKTLKHRPLFQHSDVSEEWDHQRWLDAQTTESLRNSVCFSCPLSQNCSLIIPAKPYYRKGKLLMFRRPKLELPPASKRRRSTRVSGTTPPEHIGKLV
jgi:hypothetical protein